MYHLHLMMRKCFPHICFLFFLFVKVNLSMMPFSKYFMFLKNEDTFSNIPVFVMVNESVVMTAYHLNSIYVSIFLIVSQMPFYNLFVLDDALNKVHTLQLVFRSLKELVTLLSLPLLLTVTVFFLVLVLLPMTLFIFSISFTL